MNDKEHIDYIRMLWVSTSATLPKFKSIFNHIKLMKKLIPVLLIIQLATSGYSQDTTTNAIKNDTSVRQENKKGASINKIRDDSDKLNSIVINTEKTSKNTKPTKLSNTDWDEVFNLFFSLVAAIASIYTVKSIVDGNKQQSIKTDFQLAILSDLIRHLYRNKVCICALYQKLEDHGFETHYPSEEHILKLKVLPEDLHFERFNNSPKHYGRLHELEIKFRNFNIEVDVALEHFKSKNLAKSIKLRDFDTLEFKAQYLTDQTLQLMNKIGFNWTNEIVKEVLQKVYKRYEEDLNSNNKEFEEPELEMISLPPRESKRKNYFDLIGLTDEVDAAIRSEYKKMGVIEFR